MKQPKKAGRKNSNRAVIARRAKVSELTLKGMTQTEIAEIYGVDQSQISKDVSIITENWRESSLVNINEVKNIQLAKIDLREREAWMAWEKSKLPYKENRIKTKNAVLSNDSGGEEMGVIEVEEIEQEHHVIGDPRFLSIIERCVEQRNKLLGLPLELVDLESKHQEQAEAEEQVERFKKLSIAEKRAYVYLTSKLENPDQATVKRRDLELIDAFAFMDSDEWWTWRHRQMEKRGEL